MDEQTTPGTATWDEADSEQFLDWGRYFVPAREVQMDTICRLAGTAPAGDVVELCCGQGLLSRALLDHLPQRHVHAFDGSARMIQTAAAALAGYGARFDVRAFDLADRSWRRFPWPVAAVVSSLAVHHLDGAQKQQLFADVHDALLPGGVLVLADLVRPAGAWGMDVAAAAWDETVRRRALELDGDLRGFEQFQALRWNYFRDPDGDPSDQPSGLPEQLRWLEAAGFAEVDVFWIWAGHAIYGGRKPRGPEPGS
jgi:tRNA (cmo5U34)-methyltransferase